jgi:hypothetical protein
MMSLPPAVTAALRPRAVPALGAAAIAIATIAATTAPARADGPARPAAAAAQVSWQARLLGLTTEDSNGWTAIYGTAARVNIVQGLAHILGIQSVAEYAGANETGMAILVITGNGDAPVLFATAGITVRSVDNETSQHWSIYNDATSLVAALPPGTAMNTPAVDSLYGNVTPSVTSALPLVLEASARVAIYGIGFAATPAAAGHRGLAASSPSAPGPHRTAV